MKWMHITNTLPEEVCLPFELLLKKPLLYLLATIQNLESRTEFSQFEPGASWFKCFSIKKKSAVADPQWLCFWGLDLNITWTCFCLCLLLYERMHYGSVNPLKTALLWQVKVFATTPKGWHKPNPMLLSGEYQDRGKSHCRTSYRQCILS